MSISILTQLKGLAHGYENNTSKYKLQCQKGITFSDKLIKMQSRMAEKNRSQLVFISHLKNDTTMARPKLDK